jgi:hypothetical protein
MKTIITWTAAITFALAALAFAGIPQTINYQGYLKNANGTPVTATTSIRFSLYSSNPHRNNPLWSETQITVEVKQGVYSVELGSVKSITAPFDIRYWLGVAVNSDPEMTPLQPLSSVPYSFRSGCNPGDMISCYTGPPGTLTSGICRSGTRTCPPDSSGYGSCVGEILPNPDTGCNQPSCSDTFKNQNESDVDCGGVCGSNCLDGKTCNSGSDCYSRVCHNSLCATPTCSDMVKNGLEADVDCGGVCAYKCADGKTCGSNNDCVSGVCDSTSKICAAPSCSDGIKNGTETDMDCGGICPKCSIGKMCSINSDCSSASNTACASAYCSSGFCSMAYVPNGTPTVSQIAGDCQTLQCDGSGNIVSVADNSDFPDDGNQCTSDVCVSGVSSHIPQPTGTACSQNGGNICNGSGNCVSLPL